MTAKKEAETTDIFAYVNKLLEVKEDLFVEIFFVSKNHVPYATRLSPAIQELSGQIFIDKTIEEVLDAAEFGRNVRHISYESNDPAILREDLDKVPKAESLIKWIETDRDNIEYFSMDEHELRRMAGVIVRVTHKSDRKLKFYIARVLPSARVVSSMIGWQFSNDVIHKMEVQAAFNMPFDNQTVIIGNDIFIFNQAKFEKQFSYEYAKLQKADKKAVDFNKRFKISVPSGITGVENFFRESTPLLKKFLKTDVSLMSQQQVMEVSDDMGDKLMVDDAGAIILMDKKDFNIMLDIMNDNYYESNATGKHYVASSKKPIEVGE